MSPFRFFLRAQPRRFVIAIALSLFFAPNAVAQIFVATQGSGNSKIGVYNTTGTTITLIPVVGNPMGIAVSGSSIYAARYQAQAIGLYTTAGTTVDANLITSVANPTGMALSGTNLYVSNLTNGTIGLYATNGATINTSLVSGLNGPQSIAVSGGYIYVTNFFTNTIGVYTTSGQIVNTALISGLNLPFGIAVSGGKIYVSNMGAGTIGVYTTSGALVNASLVTGLMFPHGIAVQDSKIYVIKNDGTTVGVYSTDGATINANLVTGLTSAWYIAVCPCDDGITSSSDGSNLRNLLNITNGTFAFLREIGSSYNPVLDGGALILQSGESSGQAFSVLANGGIIQSPTTGTATLSGVFSGIGGLTFTGSGTTIMSGANTYTGGTTVSSGTLSVLGDSPTGFGDVFVASSGTLMGTGTINGRLMIAGTLKPGNSPGYLAATNTVTMNAGSTYQQDIAGVLPATRTTPAGASGYYSALGITGGQFVINAGATLTPRLSNLFSPTESGYGSAIYVPVLGDRFRIVTADGGTAGRFTTVTQPAELSAGTQLLPFYNMAGSNSLDLAVIPTSYNTTIASLSGNKNAQFVGSALDRIVTTSQAGASTAAQDELLYAGSSKTAANLAGYTQSLAGEVYSAAVAVIAQATQRVQQAVQARLGDTMGIGLPQTMAGAAGNTTAMGSTNAVLAGGVPTSAMTSNPSVNPAVDAASFSNGNVWGELAYQKGNRSSDSNSGGWSSNLYQLVFGSDFYAENGMKLGGGFALSSTTLTPAYGSATIQQGSLFAYGKMPIEEFVIDAMASVGLSASDVSRSDATGLTSGFRTKNISGNDAMLSLGVSRPIDLQDIRLTPFARVTWQMVTQSGVNEGSTGAALDVNRYSGNGVRGVLGVAAGSKANNPLTEDFTYRAYIGLGADSSAALNPTVSASLAGISTSITTPKAGTTFVQAGLYGTAKFADNAYAYAGISGEARTGQTLGAVSVGVRVQF